MMPDPLKYTEEELAKELVLLEKHLKQEPYMDEDFCIDCIEKHLILIEGLAEEGIGFADDKEKENNFVSIANTANRLKREIKTSPDYVELSREVRAIRKKLSNCQTCKKIITEIRNNPNSPKDLNSSLSQNKNNPNNLTKNQKGGIAMDMKDVGIINAGAFLGKGVEVLADYVDTQFPTAGPEWYKRPSTYIDIVGGLGLQLLALYGIKNDRMKLLTVVTGAGMVTKSIDIAKEALTPIPAVRMAVNRAPLRISSPMMSPMRPTITIPTTQAAGLVVVD